MRSLSNLLKMGFANVQSSEKRMIDTNELVARRIEELAAKMAQPENAGFLEGEEMPAEGDDGFSPGLFAEQIEGLLADDDADGTDQGNVIKASGA